MAYISTPLIPVQDIEETRPVQGHTISARHQLSGWMTGVWDETKGQILFHTQLNKEPWDAEDITHFIDLEDAVGED